MANVAAAISFRPLLSEDVSIQMGSQHATPKGSAAKQQGKQTDLDIAQQYLKKAGAFEKKRS